MAHGIVKSFKIEGSILQKKLTLKNTCPFALGTIADLVPLRRKQNYLQVRAQALGYNPSIGLNALLQESKIDLYQGKILPTN